MAPVDEDQGKRGLPHFSRCLGVGHNGDDRIFKTGLCQCVSEKGEGIDGLGFGIKQVRVKIGFSGLLFFRSPVMVNGIENGMFFFAG